jgi:methionine sulfoxide reductase heme-binding subunit
MNGWRLCGVISLLLVGMSLSLWASHGWDIEGLRSVIQATARASLLLFSLAFTAGALARLSPSEATRWLRANRRYIGVSFAVSHVIHLAAIITFARVDQDLFWKLTNVANVVLGGVAYVFIAAMTATSFDRTAARLGPRRWRLLHRVGSWYIWSSFAVAVGKRVPQGPLYWAMFALVVLAAVLRIVAMQERGRRVEVAPSL